MGETPAQRCGLALWREEGRSFFFLLNCFLCLWCLLPEPCVTVYQPKHMFLNSQADCSYRDKHEVDGFSLYNLKDDIRPTTGAHRIEKCTMLFRSTRRDGRLCVFQRNMDFKNEKVQLRLYDGHYGVDGKTNADKILDLDNDGLNMVEWCTKTRNLTIRVLLRDQMASVKDVDVDLLVYDISSIHRKAYLDTGPSCESLFEMDGSQVNVSNLQSSTVPKDIHSMCSLYFEYKGQKENRSLCMAFEPYPYPGASCDFNYTLQVYEHVFDGRGGENKVLSHEGTCEKPVPTRWCSNGTKISLTLIRPTGPEDKVLFHALVLDHEGGLETLPVPSPKHDGSDETLSAVSLAMICVGVCAFIVIVVIVTVFIWRRWWSRRPQGKGIRYAGKHMIRKPSELAGNRQNIYTDNTGADF